jgi:hypothetical protein
MIGAFPDATSGVNVSVYVQEHRLTETLPSHWCKLKLLPFQQRLPPLDILLKQDLKLLLLLRGRLCRNINHRM